MPELPDVTLYSKALRERIQGQPLQSIRIASPFLLRSYETPVEKAFGKRVAGIRRIGKRIVVALEDDLFLVLHLMIAGRLHWRNPGTKLGGKFALAAFDFPNGTLILTEAGSKRRASLHIVQGEESLSRLNPGGIEVLHCNVESFRLAVLREVHTLKRALTDPRLFSGIGNAYSDEILHDAKLSPLKRTDQLSDEEIERLFESTRKVLLFWIEKLLDDTGAEFPEKVTAFREGMAVHGRYRMPCPRCGAPVQRIVYAENETNYCPKCQTSGKLLADRSLSRLLKNDWPRNLEELDELYTKRAPQAHDGAKKP